MKSKVARTGPDRSVQLVQLGTRPLSGPIAGIEPVHRWTGQKPVGPHGSAD